MPRATSRINPAKRKQIVQKPKATSRLKKTRSNKPKKTQSPNSQKNHSLGNLVINYLKHIPTLIIGLIFSYILFQFLNKVNPSNVKHFLLPNSYLPLLLLVFFTGFFLLSFLLLNSRRGLIGSLWLTIILFLQVQRVIISIQAIIILFFILVLLEILYLFANKIISQKSAKL